MFRSALRILGFLSALALAHVLPCAGMQAQGEGFEEYHVKAALLAKIPLFVEWPKDAEANNEKYFYIGILGPSPFGKHKATLEMQTVKYKKIVVLPFATMNDYKPCHMLFISSIKVGNEGAEERLTKALEKTADKRLLIIGDSEGLAEKGAVANLYFQGDSIRIEMNRDAEKRAKLTTNAQFLKIIRLVRDAK